jgi:uncharacterized protein (TIRG00374 family)
MPGAARIAALVAIVVGVTLFALTISRLDLQETLRYTRRLGLALPALLLPSVAWHLLRTWGWAVSFPERSLPVLPGTVPSFWRLFRVRLAADAISFFTVRGPTGEPLKVLLLSDHVPPAISTASITAERLAFALISVIVAGVVSQMAVRRMSLSAGWDATFTLLSIGAVLLIGLFAVVARRGTGNYVGRLLRGRRHEADPAHRSLVVRFILEVERNLLALLRGKRRRLLTLTVLPIVCYGVNALEVWAIFAAIGEPIGAGEALVIETFARLASVAGAAVPASLGTLEASHMAIATALGLSGGGALALARRLRALLWAALGLALYPRLGTTRPTVSTGPVGN